MHSSNVAYVYGFISGDLSSGVMRSFPVLVLEHTLVELAGGMPWQLLHKFDGFRTLEVSDLASRVGDEFRSVTGSNR